MQLQDIILAGEQLKVRIKRDNSSEVACSCPSHNEIEWSADNDSNCQWEVVDKFTLLSSIKLQVNACLFILVFSKKGAIIIIKII